MRVRKVGRVLVPPAESGWHASHATMPFALVEGDGIARIDLEGSWLYFSVRDGDGRSRTARAATSLDPRDPTAQLDVRPVLEPGPPGAFDDDGALGSCLVEHDGQLRLYYVGWSRSVTVPFHLFIGLAVSDDGGESFRRLSPAPIIGRSEHDPYLATAPWVLPAGDGWQMWYVSATEWERRPDGTLRHRYNIRHAESADGLEWRPTGRVCIDYRDGDEYALGRPCVFHDGDRFVMLFAFRGDAYKIGIAESEDGLHWERADSALIEPGPEEWDSEMVEYGTVVERDGERCVIYNGNGFGRTGIGLAEVVR